MSYKVAIIFIKNYVEADTIHRYIEHYNSSSHINNIIENCYCIHIKNIPRKEEFITLLMRDYEILEGNNIKLVSFKIIETLFLPNDNSDYIKKILTFYRDDISTYLLVHNKYGYKLAIDMYSNNEPVYNY